MAILKTVMDLPVSYNMNFWISCATISFSIRNMGHEVLNFRYMKTRITLTTLYTHYAVGTHCSYFDHLRADRTTELDGPSFESR